MAQGASWGAWGISPPAGRQNGRKATTPATANISALAARSAPPTSQGPGSAARVPAYISSLAMKPRNGGSPAMESAASPAASAVTGMARASPPRMRASRVPVP